MGRLFQTLDHTRRKIGRIGTGNFWRGNFSSGQVGKCREVLEGLEGLGMEMEKWGGKKFVGPTLIQKKKGSREVGKMGGKDPWDLTKVEVGRVGN